MKRAICTIVGIAAIAATAGCTPQEIAAWERYFAEQEAAPAPAPAPVVQDPALAREDCPEVFAGKLGMDWDYVAPQMGVWHYPNLGDLIGFSQYEDSRIYPTEGCAEAMPAY